MPPTPDAPTPDDPTAVGPPVHTSPADALTTRRAERLARWEHRTRPLVIVAALTPFVSAFGGATRDDPLVVLDLAAWAVFLVDFIVHLRLRPGYLRTWWGRADLAIVVLTFPFYLLPGVQPPQVLGILRLGRLARIVMVGRNLPIVRKVFDRLNRAVLYSAIILVVCSWIVYETDGPSQGFDSMWDALWWGIVTLTTVGYGDLVPSSGPGRWAGVVLMIAGLALLGTLAGSLSQIFGLEESQQQESEIDALRAEVRELRRDIHDLGKLLGVADELGATRGEVPPNDPPFEGDLLRHDGGAGSSAPGDP